MPMHALESVKADFCVPAMEIGNLLPMLASQEPASGLAPEVPLERSKSHPNRFGEWRRRLETALCKPSPARWTRNRQRSRKTFGFCTTSSFPDAASNPFRKTLRLFPAVEDASEETGSRLRRGALTIAPERLDLARARAA
jgi:hypothetical protein